MFLARAHQVMISSKGAFSLLHIRNVSKNLDSFEKVSFGKFRSTMKIALFRESAPIAPIFFWGSGRSRPGGVTGPGPTRWRTRPFYFYYYYNYNYNYYYYYYYRIFFNAAELRVPKQSASYAAVTTHH